MKIYTKTGDKGKTSLVGGTRVSKTHERIEAYGTVDELNSWLGLVRDHLTQAELVEDIKIIQERLFTIGSNLALEKPGAFKIPTLDDEDITYLEQKIDDFNTDLPEMRNFVLPGGHPNVSHCHIARTVCRRAERRVILMSEEHTIDERIIQYLNRLSDFLFVMARKLTQVHGVEETPWIPKST